MAGLAQVPEPVTDAARGMGMTRLQRLFRTEFPLAFPVILTGIRIVMVQNIGLTTIAALIGGGGFGIFALSRHRPNRNGSRAARRAANGASRFCSRRDPRCSNRNRRQGETRMIEFDRITKNYNGRAAVDEVSFTIEPHGIAAIVGIVRLRQDDMLRMVNRLEETDLRRNPH